MKHDKFRPKMRYLSQNSSETVRDITTRAFGLMDKGKLRSAVDTLRVLMGVGLGTATGKHPLFLNDATITWPKLSFVPIRMGMCRFCLTLVWKKFMASAARGHRSHSTKDMLRGFIRRQIGLTK